nr:cell division cycle 20.5, cofactor of APC complex-like [Ipomoea batatas]
MKGEYRRRLEAALKLDEEGRPFRMLVFRGSPKGSRKSIREIDEMRRSDEESFSCTDVNKQFRAFPKVRCLKGHEGRVGSIAWNGHVLTSGSFDRSIIHHDGNFLVSGGNDNLVYIWDTFKMSSRDYLHRFNDHSAAVKALAWCPYNYDVLASGGGTFDGCIKMWSIRKGACISSTETRAQASDQICGLQWNKHHKELLSGHGFGERADGTGKLCLWRYPSMSKINDSWNHASRALHLSQSPDGLTVVSAGADETLRFWEIFGPPQADKSRTSDLDNLLSLKTSPIR